VSTIFTTGLIVDWVVAVEVRSRWNSITVSIPNGSRVIRRVQSVGVGVFPEPIKIWVWRKGCPNVEILVLKHQWGSTRVKEDLAIRPRDGEAEWVFRVIELELRA
jgi:hypothetical protein